MTYHRASLGTEPAPLLFFEKSLSVPKTLKFSQVFGCITFGTDNTDGNSQVCRTARPNGCGGDEGRGPAGIPSLFFFSESHKVSQISFLFWYVQKHWNISMKIGRAQLVLRNLLFLLKTTMSKCAYNSIDLNSPLSLGTLYSGCFFSNGCSPISVPKRKPAKQPGLS